jgi:ubiquinone/menaquinone biosynthesis C-methylase UbiE
MGSVKDSEGAERVALDALVDFEGRRVLEIGCGNGRMTWLYADAAAEVLGVDDDDEAIEEARASMRDELESRVEFRVASATALGVPRQRFDIAFLSWSL